MVSSYVWRRADAEKKAALRARGLTGLRARGLCNRCFEMVWRDTRRTCPRWLLLAEWEQFSRPGLSVKANAKVVGEKLGMRWDTVYRAYYRAKRDGDL